jgi:diacylglycerol kinase family enzyme
LLFHYKPTTATVIVDGKEYTYKKVWIAPTMKGRFYGGGMMPCPAQDRLSDDGNVSVMIFHDTGKISTLMIFPSLFKGEHIKHTKHVTVHTGKNITVRFDSPRPAQIDGETVTGVTEYTAEAGVTAIV